MVAHEVFALISGRDIMNTVVGDYYNCNEMAKAEYGASAFAVEITQYPVEIGDHYLNGVFYKGEEGAWVEVDQLPTEEGQIAILMAQNADLQEYVDTISLAITDIVESMVV